MRKLTCLLLLGLGLTAQAQTETYLNVDFKKGIPTDFVLKDYNENPIIPTDFKVGRVNDTWSMFTVDGDNIKAALSTSRGEREIAADKWMITPSIEITSDKAWLSWKAKSIHYDLRDGYKVMISTTDQSPASFQEVFNIKEEDYFWAHHFVSLKEYKGKHIYVAFVNNSVNKYILAVTNLFIGIPTAGEFEVIDETPRFVGDVSTTSVKGKIRNLGGAVNMRTLSCITKDGKESTQSFDNMTLNPGEETAFEFDIPVTVGNVSNYTLKVSTDHHDSKEVLKDSIICSSYPLTLVAEEFTGTWCNGCPRGTLYMHLLKKRYKDQIITIIGHCNDDMTDAAYNLGLRRWIFDLPGFIYNRNGSSVYNPEWNNKFEDAKLAKFILRPVDAKIELTAKYDDPAHTTISTKAEIFFSKELDNSTDRYRIGYAVVEKSVSGFDQQNILDVPSTKEFYFLPSPIPSHLIAYHDVARGTENAFIGIESSLPTSIGTTEGYSFEYLINIPTKVTNNNNLSVVSFIIDTKTGAILNACEVKEPTIHPLSVIEEHKSNDLKSLVAYPDKDNQRIMIELPEGIKGEMAKIQMSGLDGQVIYSNTEGTGKTLSIPTNGLKGYYIIHVTIGEQLLSRKIVLF